MITFWRVAQPLADERWRWLRDSARSCIALSEWRCGHATLFSPWIFRSAPSPKSRSSGCRDERDGAVLWVAFIRPGHVRMKSAVRSGAWASLMGLARNAQTDNCPRSVGLLRLLYSSRRLILTNVRRDTTRLAEYLGKWRCQHDLWPR